MKTIVKAKECAGKKILFSYIWIISHILSLFLPPYLIIAAPIPFSPSSSIIFLFLQQFLLLVAFGLPLISHQSPLKIFSKWSAHIYNFSLISLMSFPFLSLYMILFADCWDHLWRQWCNEQHIGKSNDIFARLHVKQLLKFSLALSVPPSFTKQQRENRQHNDNSILERIFRRKEEQGKPMVLTPWRNLLFLWVVV